MRGQLDAAGKTSGTGGPAAILAHRLLQVRLKRGEPDAFGGWQLGSFGQQVDHLPYLLELRWCVQPD
jgi:hypothetical protein